ncbi:Transposon Ty3-I Gag-Pol polyprotein [Cucumis melo var. makuwa]|uniref:Transposon Ty3-I Gag-Pol polyprotein n=1 Tax=Cucumis melo var. makuwa TaxID=1194695 RepID=A0A5D3BXA5_CUCMM|nr:Transposon Ty3-I Gag-Pol polyprotein [Cucumis melo var. makuwa]
MESSWARRRQFRGRECVKGSLWTTGNDDREELPLELDNLDMDFGNAMVKKIGIDDYRLEGSNSKEDKELVVTEMVEELQQELEQLQKYADVRTNVEHLARVFQLLLKHSLYANKKKSQFTKDEIEYLRHWFFRQRKSVFHQIPDNVKELRRFMGLTRYYRRFVASYDSIAAPLTRLTKKSGFRRYKEVTTTFETLKKAMVTLPVLALLDFNIPFKIEIDTLGVGLEAMPLQNKKPIVYFGQKLSTVARQKSMYERELMAIVLSVEKW